MASTEKAELRQILQICVVVRDLQAAMKRYWEIFGIGPWEIRTLAPPALISTTIRGKPGPYTLKLAVAQVGNIQWELIEPLTGPSIYQEFLDQKGEGMHHILCVVDDYDQTVTTLAKHGIDILMEGSTSAGATFAYLDTEKQLGTIIELLKLPPGFEKPPNEATWPPLS